MIYYGAAYYPEHVAEDTWANDAVLMRDAGFNVVRIGEFAWCRMEPAEDQFTFGWLDRAIQTVAAQGVQVLIGTPTAGPPAWLVNAKTPEDECRQVYEDGIRMEFGARNMLCVHHPRFIARAIAIAGALGQHFADNSHVCGYQLDNEPGMYGHRCYCAFCVRGFREWLRRKYGTIETLNQRLGMIFGSNEFGSFADIPMPRLHQEAHNPGLLMDSERFFSETNAAFLNAQADAIRTAGARQPITTNVCHMFHGRSLDECQLFVHLDIAGWDCYPVQFGVNPRPEQLGLLHAIARAYKQGKPYWMLEQQSGSPPESVADDVRRIRLWAWQSLAHGAEMLLYFNFRTARFGGEQYWRGVLDHDSLPNARYRMVTETGAEAAKLGDWLSGLKRSYEAAILLDHDSCVSLALIRPGSGLDYRGWAQEWFAAVHYFGCGCDVVFPGDDLSRYKHVIAPLLRVMSIEIAEQLRAYVSGGGTLIAGPILATQDSDFVAPPAGTYPPHLLQDIFGVDRVEWSSLSAVTAPPKERQAESQEAWKGLNNVGEVPVEAVGEGETGAVYRCRVWCDHMQARSGTEIRAQFACGGPAEGLPALTANRFGAGQAIYVAGIFSADFCRAVLKRVLRPAAAPLVRPVDDGSNEPGIEIVHAADPAAQEARVFFVLNHAATPKRVTLSGAEFTDRLSGRSYPEGVIEIAPYDVHVFEYRPRH